MKKLIFTLMFIFGCLSMNAQIKVNSDGSTQFKTGSYSAGFTGNAIDFNVSFGYGTLHSNTTGRYNTAIGYEALYNGERIGLWSPNNNTANGYRALYNNTIGTNNTAVGSSALINNTTGNYNTAIGRSALYGNTTGGGNTAIGFNALQSNTTGGGNVAIGDDALCCSSTGSHNTVIGYQAFCDSSGSGNTAIGVNTDVNGYNLSNTIAIGNGTRVSASNEVKIGNSSITSIGGQVAWTAFSDGRAKKNIRAEVPGLAFINLLQPLTYNLNLDAIDELQKSDNPKINARRDSLRKAQSPEAKAIEAKAKAAQAKIVYTGFIAQDVEKAAQSIGYDFSGVDAPENDNNAYGLRYAEFVVPLVKAVQELSEQNDRLQEQINQLMALVGEKPMQRSITDTETNPQLLQNVPNPFNVQTEIGYYVPETVNTANLYIYDLNGIQQRKFTIIERGNGATILQASALNAGIYFYTLICDGKPVDTKQMILTK